MSTLFRQEVRLARTEVAEKFGQATGAIVLLVIAAILIIPALVILLQSIATFLAAAGIPVEWSALLVSLVVIVIAAILAGVGLAKMKTSNLTPDRTIQQVRRDAAVAKDQIQ
jgi:hypothetical protein